MRKLLLSISGMFIMLFASVASANFVDVMPQSKFFDAVQYFTDDFPILATDREYFHPYSSVTNAEFYKLILAGAGFEPSANTVAGLPCNDVKGDEWYAPYVKKALELNLVYCDSTNFDPTKTLSRKEGIQKIFQLYDLPTSDPSATKEGYLDVKTTSNYAGIVQAAYEMQLLSDYESQYFYPEKILTKADIVNILYGVHLNIEYLPYIKEPDTTNSAQTNQISSDIEYEEKFSIFLDVWDKITNDYIEKNNINKDALLSGAISGMVDKLMDPYSVYYEPSDAINYQESLDGSFEGIGIFLNEENGNLVVVTPLKGSPAEKAGIKSGDIIIEIDDVLVSEMELDEFLLKLRGPTGTTVKLKIKRGASTSIISITRAKIDVPYVESEMKNGIGIIHYYQFTANSHEQFLTEIKKLTAQNPKGLIIDMRNNPGGYLTSAQELVSHFMPKDKIFVNLIFADGSTDSQKSIGAGELSKYPLIILLNEGSASASEIAALALKDVNKAKIVGTTSYGKGKIQEIITYDDNSSLKLSIAKWSSPAGTIIDGKGIIPDYFVEMTEQNIADNYDAQMEKALKLF